MIEGALLTVNAIMALIFIAASLWSWLKEQDMQSTWVFLAVAITYGLNIMYIIPLLCAVA